MTLFRTLDIILVAIMVCCAAVTYKVKYDVQKSFSNVKKIERQIIAEKNSIHMLRAEWAKMTQPQRLLELTERYQAQLGLETIEARQIVSFNDIPERDPSQEPSINQDEKIKENNEILANRQRSNQSVDLIRTGSLR